MKCLCMFVFVCVCANMCMCESTVVSVCTYSGSKDSRQGEVVATVVRPQLHGVCARGLGHTHSVHKVIVWLGLGHTHQIDASWMWGSEIYIVNCLIFISLLLLLKKYSVIKKMNSNDIF